MSDSYFDQIKESLDAGKVIDASIVLNIVSALKEVLFHEDNLLILQAPITVCGDIHGQYEDLLELFDTAGGIDQKFLFMGDYVDRGYYSLNTFLLLATLKLKYPDKYYLLRGNHECRLVTNSYGFLNEILQNYGSSEIWIRMMDLFDLLPISALIDNDIFSIHGGLSPQLPLISLIYDIDRKKEIPPQSIISDLTWSDPDEKLTNWVQGKRGSGCNFGKDQCLKFCHLNRLRLVTRSHQLANDGYKYYFANPKNKVPEGRLLLVWSAPNYAYVSGNRASILQLGKPDSDFRYQLKVFDQRKDRIKRPEPNFQSQYFA